MQAAWEPSQELAEVLHARLVDGRLVHQHVLLVEPVQQRMAGAPPGDPPPQPVDVALAALRGAGVHGEPRTGAGTGLAVARAQDGAIAPASAAEAATVAAAEGLLRAAGLSFVVQLGLGLVLVEPPQDRGGASGPPRWPRTCRLDAVAPPDRCARVLLAAAAGSLARQWLEVELSFVDVPVPALEAELETMAGLFGACLLSELERRLAAGGDRQAAARRAHHLGALAAERPRFERWLEAPPEVPLTRELLCCWYPCWRRSRFLFGASPFDTLGALPLPRA